MELRLAQQLLRNAGGCNHLLQVYEDDSRLIRTLEFFILSGLEGKGAVILIATAEHLLELEARIGGRGLPLDRAREEGRYIELDARATLEGFMVKGWPVAERFRAAVRPHVRRARAAGGPVRAFGEMVGLLMANGQKDATIRLEQLWNEVCRERGLPLFCAYSRACFGHRSGHQVCLCCRQRRRRVTPKR